MKRKNDLKIVIALLAVALALFSVALNVTFYLRLRDCEKEFDHVISTCRASLNTDSMRE